MLTEVIPAKEPGRPVTQEITPPSVLQTVLRFTSSVASCQRQQATPHLGVSMLRTGKIALISWGLPLLAAASFGQTPSHHPKIQLLRQPVARPGVAMPAIPS